MNSPMPSEDPLQRLERLAEQARRDTPPAIDAQRLLRLAYAQPLPPKPTWLDEIIATFLVGRAVPLCALGTAALLMFTVWQYSDYNASLAWEEFAAVPQEGGMP